ncbi:hypothetical protein [Glutamicibacter sp.]|jgi:hypothetical protein|uniref:hypothetical protein n=1 Tax=Glutamicibacter sp. TaxID=1931995 RepID=UPI002FDA83BB
MTDPAPAHRQESLDEKMVEEAREAYFDGGGSAHEYDAETPICTNGFRAALLVAVKATRAECAKAVDDEPELNDEPPPEMKEELKKCFPDFTQYDFDTLVGILRLTVKLTKDEIRKRIERAHD